MAGTINYAGIHQYDIAQKIVKKRDPGLHVLING